MIAESASAQPASKKLRQPTVMEVMTDKQASDLSVADQLQSVSMLQACQHILSGTLTLVCPSTVLCNLGLPGFGCFAAQSFHTVVNLQCKS